MCHELAFGIRPISNRWPSRKISNESVYSLIA